MNQLNSLTTQDMGRPSVTYKQLKERILEEPKNRGRNRAALDAWMSWAGRMDYRVAGQEFDEEKFPRRREQFLEWCGERMAEGALRNRRSAINHIREVYCELAQAALAATIEEGTTLQSCLRVALAAAGLTNKAAITRWGAGFAAYLYTNVTPNRRGAATLAKIEAELGCQPGYLTRFASWVSARGMIADFSGHLDPYRELLPRLCASPYHVSFHKDPAMADLKKAWDRFHSYQIAVDPILERSERWGKNERGEYPSASRYLNAFQSFFGWLVLPRGDDPWEGGLGLPKEILSFSMVGVWDLWRRFMEFRHQRSGGGETYSGEAACHLNIFNKMTHPEKGWLTQTEGEWLPQLAAALHVAGYNETPQPGFFKGQHAAKGGWLDRVRPEFEPRREPDETLARFLAPRSPMSQFIYPLIARLEEMPPTWAGPEAIFNAERRLVTIVAFFSVPMRQKNWETCEIGKHIVKEEDGFYHLKVRAKEMKNRRRLRREKRRKGYDITIPRWAQPYIAHWIEDVLPSHPQGMPRHLLTGWRGGKPSAKALRDVFRAVFKKHFGFAVGPHAARHIVATDYLRHDPRDVYAVSVFLADTVETVVRHYSHLIDQDLILAFDEYSTEQAQKTLGRKGITVLY